MGSSSPAVTMITKVITSLLVLSSSNAFGQLATNNTRNGRVFSLFSIVQFPHCFHCCHLPIPKHHLWRLVWRRVPCGNLRPNQLDKPPTTVHPRGAHDRCHPQPDHQHRVCSRIQPG